MKKWSSYIASCLPLLAVFFLLFSGTASAQSVNQTHVASAQHTASAKRALTPQCHYTDSSCTGQDPYNTLAPNGTETCGADNRVLQYVYVPEGIVYLLWSNNCGTNWAETVNNGGGSNPIMNANVTRSDGVRYDGTWYDPVSVWSPMVFAPVLAAQGCGSVNNLSGGCTNWF